jgi:hypothetical protein
MFAVKLNKMKNTIFQWRYYVANHNVCRNIIPVISSFMICHRACKKNNTTGATCGAETAYTFGAFEFTPVFSGVRVARSLVFCVMFYRSLFAPFCAFSFGHCVVCPSIYDFWLPIWYLQTFLITCRIFLSSHSKHHYDAGFINIWIMYYIIYLRYIFVLSKCLIIC